MGIGVERMEESECEEEGEESKDGKWQPTEGENGKGEALEATKDT